MSCRKQYMTERIDLPNKEKVRTPGEKETDKYLGILEADTSKQVLKEKKRVSQLNKKTTRNLTI